MSSLPAPGFIFRGIAPRSAARDLVVAHVGNSTQSTSRLQARKAEIGHTSPPNAFRLLRQQVGASLRHSAIRSRRTRRGGPAALRDEVAPIPGTGLHHLCLLLAGVGALQKRVDANRCESRYNCGLRGGLDRVQVRSLVVHPPHKKPTAANRTAPPTAPFPTSHALSVLRGP